MDGPIMAETERAQSPRKKKPKRNRQLKSEAAAPPIAAVQPVVSPVPEGCRASSLSLPCDCCGERWSGLKLARMVDGESEPVYFRVMAARQVARMPRYTLRVDGEEDVTFDTFREFKEAVGDGYHGHWDIWPPIPETVETWLCDGCWNQAEQDGLGATLDAHHFQALRDNPAGLSSRLRELLTHYRDQHKRMPETPLDALDDAFIHILLAECETRDFAATMEKIIREIGDEHYGLKACMAVARDKAECPVAPTWWKYAAMCIQSAIPADPANWVGWQVRIVELLRGLPVSCASAHARASPPSDG